MTRRDHYCSFCGKAKDEVEQLLAGPCVEVCNECIDQMHEMVHKSKPLLRVTTKSIKEHKIIPFRGR